MELSPLFEQLISHSPFVAFLLYQYWQQRKDMAQLQDRYENLRKESKDLENIEVDDTDSKPIDGESDVDKER